MWVILMMIGVSMCLNLFKDTDWSSDYMVLSEKSKVFYYLVRSYKEDSPLVVWIGGGPGCSAGNLLFLEAGPYVFNSSLNYTPNTYSWNRFANILYLDFPFSTGLSENEEDSEVIKNINAAANQLNKFMVYFFEMNDEYLGKKLYFACESYSCQIVIKFASNYNFKRISGLILRNPMLNYKIQSNWAKFAQSIDKINYFEYFISTALIFYCKLGIQLNSESVIRNFCDPTMERTARKSHIKCLDNINNTQCYDKEYYTVNNLLNNFEVQKSLGLNKQVPFTICNTTISYYMDIELKQGDTKELGYLLDKGINVKMIFGNNSFMNNWVGGKEMAESIGWNKKEDFKSKKMDVFDCGRKKEVESLRFVVLDNAGHVMTREVHSCFFKELTNFIS